MRTNYKFGIIGGDSRQIFTAQSILLDNHHVEILGFDKADINIKSSNNIEDLIKNSDCIILPVPTLSDNNIIYAPLSSNDIRLDDFAHLLKDKKVFYGMPTDIEIFNKKIGNIKPYNYLKRNEFAILNALPTSEAAIQIALTERNQTLHGSKCLVAGFGRIGKLLAKTLKAMGADVTVSARKPEDIAWIHSLQYSCVQTNHILDNKKYDIVFNTIPHLIFNKNVMTKCTHENSLIIDLASKPGGVDFYGAKDLNIQAIHALALPGKYFPRTAGDIIKKVIYNILEEEYHNE